MKITATIGAFFLLSLTAGLFAGEGETTVKGEIVDLSCYMTQGAHGKEHQQCAQSCIERGIPMGLLTESGDVYLLLENHKQKEAYETAKKHAAEIVEVTGPVSERGGVKALRVDACSKS